MIAVENGAVFIDSLLRPVSRKVSRRQLAAQRVQKARDLLTNCRLCAHDCSVNRLAGESGLCHAGATARVFLSQVEVADELELVPTFAIALSGCDLRCSFCITGAQSWNANAGEPLDVSRISARATEALDRGARTIMILGGEPTIHLPSVLEIIAALPDEARLVWKTNAHGTAQARALLSGLCDVWLADFKFGNDACAQRLARIPNYIQVVRENLLWAAGETELIVRHLIMPGHIECCWRPVAVWLAATFPEIKVSLREGYWPGWQAKRHAELCEPVSPRESERAFAVARELKLNLVP
jgi:putative pyruvate formate lyase activating enzyme